ncbi:MAG: type I phosphomannose isomerase catalytic subunit, partial [Chloroflexota bacterium]
MSQLYPLAFEPIFKDYIWGGRRLETALGRTIPDGIVAESWEIAAHANGSSTVAAGPLQGQTLGQVQEQFGVELVGTRNQAALEQGRFPLLIKLLDANRWLSVQVHPDDAYGLANENDLGKTEMWVILHAEPESKIVYGFKSGVTREAFAEALAAERCEDWLHYVPVQTGDVVFVPAGSIHALG